MKIIRITEQKFDPSSDPTTKAEKKTKIKSKSRSQSGAPPPPPPPSAPVPAVPATSAPVNLSAPEKICIIFFTLLFVMLSVLVVVGYWLLTFLIGVDVTAEALNPKLAPAFSLFSAFLSIMAPLILLMGCRYRQNPSRTIREFSAILGMIGAVIAGYFTGMWHIMGYVFGLYPIINMIMHPWALALGIPSSLFACIMFTYHRKTLLTHNMLKKFYKIQRVGMLSNLILFLDLFYMIQNVKSGLLVICTLLLSLNYLLYFFSNEAQETLRVADLGLFVKTTFWQVVYIYTSLMTYVNLLVVAGMGRWMGIPLTLILWPILVYGAFCGSVSMLESFDSNDTNEDLERG